MTGEARSWGPPSSSPPGGPPQRSDGHSLPSMALFEEVSAFKGLGFRVWVVCMRAATGASSLGATSALGGPPELGGPLGPPGGAPRLRVFEFFCGIGGLRLGLREAVAALARGGSRVCAEVVKALDVNEVSNAVYACNFGEKPHCVSIEHLALTDVDGLADVWVLSPPCQPYTRGGKGLDVADWRAAGLLHLLDLLRSCACPPQALFLENVRGFEASETRERMQQVLRARNYYVEEYLLSPTQLGVPNTRVRYYCLAVRQQQQRHLPHQQHQGQQERQQQQEQHLPLQQQQQQLHFPRQQHQGQQEQQQQQQPHLPRQQHQGQQEQQQQQQPHLPRQQQQRHLPHQQHRGQQEQEQQQQHPHLPHQQHQEQQEQQQQQQQQHQGQQEQEQQQQQLLPHQQQQQEQQQQQGEEGEVDGYENQIALGRVPLLPPGLRLLVPRLEFGAFSAERRMRRVGEFLETHLPPEEREALCVSPSRLARFVEETRPQPGDPPILAPAQTSSSSSSSGFRLEIVGPEATACGTFTKGYGRNLHSGGPLLLLEAQTHQSPSSAPGEAAATTAASAAAGAATSAATSAATTTAEAAAAAGAAAVLYPHRLEPHRFRRLREGERVRFFSIREILKLHGFPPTFRFPLFLPYRKRAALVGNSVNVPLVSLLLQHLLLLLLQQQQQQPSTLQQQVELQQQLVLQQQQLVQQQQRH
ncbi:hypothetical protein Esti_003443 [Eimeria stiedai]